MSSVFAKYALWLEKKPVVANAITSAFLFGGGDFLAQTLFPVKGAKYDYKRTIRNAVYGGIIFSPLVTKWYAWLSTSVRYPLKTFLGVRPSGRQRSMLDAVSRTACDQLIWAPMGIPLYFVCMSLMQNQGKDEIRAKLNDKYWETLVNNWKVWPAFQAVNFYLVPPAYRLLSVNVISILWNCYLSYENYRQYQT